MSKQEIKIAGHTIMTKNEAILFLMHLRYGAKAFFILKPKDKT